MTRLFLLLSLFLFFGLALKAQPNVTQAHLPKPGDTYYLGFSAVDSVVNISAGANQTWDFSSLGIIAADTLSYVSPAGVPGSASFPQATTAIKQLGDGNQFFRSSAQGLDFLGSFYPQGPNPVLGTQKCSPPLPLLPLGLTLNQSRVIFSRQIGVDSLAPNSFTQQVNGFRHEFTYHGWGTLLLPNLPPRQVMVLKVSTSNRDSLFSSTSINGPFTFTEVLEDNDDFFSYMFVQAQSPTILMELNVFQTGDGDDNTGFRLQSSTAFTSASKNWQEPNFRIFPNPVGTNQNMVLENIPSGAETVHVLDGLGREIAVYPVEVKDRVQMPVLPMMKPGLFFVRFSGHSLSNPGKVWKGMVQP